MNETSKWTKCMWALRRYWFTIRQLAVGIVKCPPFAPGSIAYNRFSGRVAQSTNHSMEGNLDQLWEDLNARATRRTDNAAKMSAALNRTLTSLIQFSLIASGIVATFSKQISQGDPKNIWVPLTCFVIATCLAVRYLMPVGIDPEAWKQRWPEGQYHWKTRVYLEELHDAYAAEHANAWVGKCLWFPVLVFVAGLVAVIWTVS